MTARGRIVSLGPVPLPQTPGSTGTADQRTPGSARSEGVIRTPADLMRELYLEARQGEQGTMRKVIDRFCRKHGIPFSPGNARLHGQVD